jgi:hypothetical protein
MKTFKDLYDLEAFIAEKPEHGLLRKLKSLKQPQDIEQVG